MAVIVASMVSKCSRLSPPVLLFACGMNFREALYLPQIGLSKGDTGMAGQNGPAPETGAGPLRSEGKACFPAR